jgi:hypothetical protein
MQGELQKVILGLLIFVLCSLLIPSPEITLAQDSDFPTFSEEDCTKCDDLNLKFNRESASSDEKARASWIDCIYGSYKAKEDYVTIRMNYWEDPQKALEYYREQRAIYQNDVKQLWPKNDIKLIQVSDESDRYGRMGYGINQDFYLSQEIILRHDHYTALIEVSFWSGGEEEARRRFKDAEAKAICLLDAKARDRAYTIKLEHYHPFDTMFTGYARQEYQPGDLVATVRDNDGNPVVGETVYFTSSPQNPNVYADVAYWGIASRLSAITRRGGPDWYGPRKMPQGFIATITDENGIAKINYNSVHIGGGHLFDYYNLWVNYISKNLEVKIPVYAIVVDPDDENQNLREIPLKLSDQEVKAYASTLIEFDSMAAIVELRHNINHVPDIRLGSENGELVKGEDLPRRMNNSLRFFKDAYTDVTVRWLNGMSATFKTKKAWEEPDKLFPVDITYADAGNYRMFDEYVGSFIGEAFVGGGGAIMLGVGLKYGLGAAAAGGVLLSAPVGGACIAAVVIYELAQYSYDPLEVVIHSDVLLDIDDANKDMRIHTLEGTATLYDMDDDSLVDIPAGYRIVVHEDGKFGTLEAFEENDLDEDLVDLLEGARLDDIATSSTTILMPSGMGGQSPDEIESIEHPDDWAGKLSDGDSEANMNISENPEYNIITYLGYVGVVAVVLLIAAVMVRNNKRKKDRSLAYATVRQPVIQEASPPPQAGPQLQIPTATLTTKDCGKCGSKIQLGDLFCKKCGLKVTTDTNQDQSQERIFCTQCGTSNPGNSRFCKKCGSEIES